MFRKSLVAVAVSVSLGMSVVPVAGLAQENGTTISVADVVRDCLATDVTLTAPCAQLVEAYIRSLAGLTVAERDEALQALALQLVSRVNRPGFPALNRPNVAAGLNVMRRALRDPALVAIVEQTALSLERPIMTAAIPTVGTAANSTPADSIVRLSPTPVPTPPQAPDPVSPEAEPEMIETTLPDQVTRPRRPAATLSPGVDSPAPQDEEQIDAGGDDAETDADTSPSDETLEEGEGQFVAFSVIRRTRNMPDAEAPGDNDVAPPPSDREAGDGVVDFGREAEGDDEPGHANENPEQGLSDH